MSDHQASSGSSVVSERPAPEASPRISPPLQEVPIINIKLDREIGNGNYQRPPFLGHFPFEMNPTIIRAIILPYLCTCLFVMDSQVDVTYFWQVVCTYGAAPYITKVAFNGFYWFSGLRDNRYINPSLAVAASLTSLQEMTLVFHTAGITKSRYTERQRLRLERHGFFEQSRLLRCMRLGEVGEFYDLQRILFCGSLQVLRCDLITSPIIRHYCRQGNPIGLYLDLIRWFREIFLQYHGRPLLVEYTIDGGNNL